MTTNEAGTVKKTTRKPRAKKTEVAPEATTEAVSIAPPEQEETVTVEQVAPAVEQVAPAVEQVAPAVEQVAATPATAPVQNTEVIEPAPGSEAAQKNPHTEAQNSASYSAPFEQPATYVPPVATTTKQPAKDIWNESPFTFIGALLIVVSILTAFSGSVASLLMSSAALVFAIIGLVKKEKRSWINWVVIGLSALGAIAFVLFVLFVIFIFSIAGMSADLFY